MFICKYVFIYSYVNMVLIVHQPFQAEGLRHLHA